MVNTLPTSQDLVTDDWVQGTWDKFLELCDRPDLEKAKFYYDDGWMRIEIRRFLAKRPPSMLGEGGRIWEVSQRGSQNCRDFTLKPKN